MFITKNKNTIFSSEEKKNWLIIGSVLDIKKKSLTTRKSRYIELIFHKKSAPKMPKIVQNSKNWDFEPRFHGN